MILGGLGCLAASIIITAVILLGGGFLVWRSAPPAPPRGDLPRETTASPSPQDGDGGAGEVDEPVDLDIPEDVPIPERGNRDITSFRAAKLLLGEWYAREGYGHTFYCGCVWSDRHVDLKSCGYEVRRQQKRARRIEYEHIVPASRFGHSFTEWTEGHPDCVRSSGETFHGRRCARRASPAFERMEADMHNLVPTVGEVNGDRSNYAMAMLEGEDREYGRCDVEIRDEQIEPRPEVRGDVARTYLYMTWAYPKKMRLTESERAMFYQWHRADPVDARERARAQAIARLQGNSNPYITAPR